MKCPNGSESVLGPFPWAQLLAIRNCPCEDGKARYARITGQPDTFFSVPASVQVSTPDGRKTVSGFVTSDSDGYEFRAVKYGKNYKYLPK